jgi:hypothetical protein
MVFVYAAIRSPQEEFISTGAKVIGGSSGGDGEAGNRRQWILHPLPRPLSTFVLPAIIEEVHHEGLRELPRRGPPTDLQGTVVKKR